MAYLGIDLGTTNSVAVIFDDIHDRLEIVKTEGIDEVLPSVVCFGEDGITVGNEAKNGAIIYPRETVMSVKRLMGETTGIQIHDKSYLPQEISAILLKTLKEAAREQWGEDFEEVVITHPAYFNDRQIYATKQAGEIAGFKRVHLLSEPLAAAIEYGYKQGYAQTLLVYDLGGGTFDACVLKVNKDLNGNETFQELADVGDMHLGGDDFDLLLIDYMVKKFELMTGVVLDKLPQETYIGVLQKLKAEGELLKKKLSTTQKAVIQISPLLVLDGVPMNLVLEVTKDDFEGLIRSHIDKSREITLEALARAGKEPDDISKVILVGGSTLIPMVKRMIAGAVKEPYRATDPAKSVAMGAAIYNYLMHLPNSPVQVGQIARQHIGTEAIINKTTGQRGLIPIIPMGTQIPVRMTDEQFAVTGGSAAVRVDVYQWEEEEEANRKYIGSVVLEGIREDSGLAITYAIDEDNLFQVHVRDKVTGREVVADLDRTRTMPKLPETVHLTDEGGLNIVFIIDTTGSMDIFLDGVREKAIEFSNILKERGILFNLGLIGFGDLGEREKPTVYKMTKDVAKFQKYVRKIKRTYGGDLPESSLDALETGLALIEKSKVDKTHKNIFILITDAPPHIPTQSGRSVTEVCDALEDMRVTTYVVARKDRQSLEAYTPVVGQDGRYYSMEESFHDILDHIAYSIAELVRVEV